MKKVLFMMVLWGWGNFSAAQHSIPLQLDSLFNEIFKGHEIRPALEKVHQQIAQADPFGKYPEWKLRAWVVEAWQAYRMSFPSEKQEELANLCLAHIEKNNSSNREEWVLAKADFYEWYGRYVYTILNEGYLSSLAHYRAYHLRGQYLPENHPLMIRALAFVEYREIPIRQYLLSFELTKRVSENPSALEDPFMPMYLTMPSFNQMYMLSVTNEGLLDKDRLSKGDSLNRFYLQQVVKTIGILKNNWGEGAIALAHNLKVASRTYQRLGDQENAKAYWQEYEQRMSELPEESDPVPDGELNWTINREPDSEASLQDAQNAQAFMAYFIPSLNKDNLLENPEIPRDDYGTFALHWPPLASKAGTLAYSLLASSKPGIDSLQTVCEAMDKVQDMVLYLLEKGLIANFNYFQHAFLYKTMDLSFRCALSLWQQTGDKKWLEKGYGHYSFGKNMELFISFWEEASLDNGAIKDLSQKMKRMELKKEELANSGLVDNLSAIAALNSEMFDLEVEKRELMSQLKLQKEHAFFEQEKDALLVSFLQSKLRKGEAILEMIDSPYFPNFHGQLLITKDTVAFIPFSEDYFTTRHQLQSLQQEIIQKGDYEELAKTVYDNLFGKLEPFLPGMEHFYISANGIVQEIPLEVLLYLDPESGRYEFLLNRFTFAQHYNIRLLAKYIDFKPTKPLSVLGVAPFAMERAFDENNNQQIPEALRGHLIRGGFYYGEDSTLIDLPLPASRVEIEEVVEEQLEGKTLFLEEATESNFKKLATEFGILHLATHARLDSMKPALTRLLFQPEADQNEDGILHVYELQSLDLSAELAVLSACQTGNNPLALYSYWSNRTLSFGFSIAGIKNLIVSQWDLPDEASSYLMRRFYKHLADKHSLPKALQKAKQDYLANAEVPEQYKHPYYWAGYRFIGQNQPLVFKPPLKKQLEWLLPAGAVFILLLTVFLLRKRK